jgi:hypothetical protein
MMLGRGANVGADVSFRQMELGEQGLVPHPAPALFPAAAFGPDRGGRGENAFF